jgi:hypothetical protein
VTNHASAQIDCLLAGEFVDEAELPTDLTFHRGEVVRPQVVGSFLDVWASDYDVREFTVLLRTSAASSENQPVHVFKVRGYRLQRVASKGEGESSWLGILAGPGEKDVYAALFPSGSVIAAFCGDARLAEPGLAADRPRD